jgi:hypothetical protein
VIEPPYSKDLVHWLMPIIGDQEVFDSKTRDKHPSLKEFLNIAKGL